jgi:TadE-like protein
MKFLIRQIRLKRLHETDGSEIAEAAVILPMLFMLLLSIYWFGRAFSIHSTINHAAREASRTAASPACANCVAACTWPGSSLPCDGSVADVVDQTLTAAHLDIKQAQPFTPSPTPPPCPGVSPEGLCATASGGNITICRNVVLDQNSTSAQACGVIISFQYPYQFALPFTSLNNQKILLKAQAETGSEN